MTKACEACRDGTGSSDYVDTRGYTWWLCERCVWKKTREDRWDTALSLSIELAKSEMYDKQYGPKEGAA